MTVYCQRPGCEKTWPRTPELEVECPVCGQSPGSECVERAPSGHVKSAAFVGLPPWGHDERHFATLEAGAFGECPKGRCPSPEDVDRVRARWERKKGRRRQERDTEQLEAFA